MTKEERLKAIQEIGNENITNEKIKKVLDQIKNLVPRIEDLYETICACKKNCLRVSNYETSNNGYNKVWFYDRKVIAIKCDCIDNERYWYIDYKGDVYTSNYAWSIKDNECIFSDTFKVRCKYSKEEWALATLEQLKYMIEMFEKFEKDVYADIDNQISYKKQEMNG